MGNRANKTGRKRRTTLVKGIQDTETLQALEETAAKLGLEIRNEKGDFKSGFCTVNDQNFIILKKDELPERKIVLIAERLAELEYEKFTPNPAIVEFINQIKNDRESPDSEED